MLGSGFGAGKNENAADDLEQKKMSILLRMKESKMYWKLKASLQKEIRSKGSGEDMSGITLQQMQQKSIQSGIEEQLRQLIASCASKSMRTEPIKTDAQDFINQSRAKWTEILLKHYDYVENKVKTQQKSAGNSNGNGGSGNDDATDQLFVYDDKNFFNFMLTIRNSSAVSLSSSAPNTLMKVSFITPSISDLRLKYDHLFSGDNAEFKNSPEFRLREKKAKQYSENEALESEIEDLAKGGLPSGERVELYMKYFSIESSSYKYFAKLEEEVDKKEILYDEILLSDSEEVADNDQYFIFQEIVERITQAFMRDSEVKDKLKIYSLVTDKLGPAELAKIPQCHMIPMKSFSMLVAPFGFCSNKVDITYMIFKEFFCNFFCHLHCISSQPNGIVFLSALFEELMTHNCNKLMSHLASINVEPLKYAFPWMQFCFFGHTTIENIFFLLDRIIGYRSLDILPVFAMGIFKLNQNEILKCKTSAELDTFFLETFCHDFLSCVRAAFT